MKSIRLNLWSVHIGQDSNYINNTANGWLQAFRFSALTMRCHCVAIKRFILFGLVTFVYSTTVITDKIDEKSANSSLMTNTTTIRPSNAGNKCTLPTETVTMRDIRNAFNLVAIDSNQIDNLISNMFNLSLINPIYVFRLPKSGDRYLTMQKSDFVQPTFPNLTSSYIRLMKSKRLLNEDYKRAEQQHIQPTTGYDGWRNRVNLNSVKDDDTTLFLNLQTERNFIKYLNNLNKKETFQIRDKKEVNDDWSLLGLHGWQGVLSKPIKRNPQPLNDERSKEMWDLPGRMEEDSVERYLLESMRESRILKAVGNLAHSKYLVTNTYAAHLDSDVYIGRANDPFGHSTKWKMKNSSLDVQFQLADRKKRAVIELYSMIKCSTGCDPIIYKGYGCYCGFLGDGQAIDGIDKCCKVHDKCYEHSNCISYLEYFVPYIWKCYRGKPVCAIDHGEWGGPKSCAARLCKCDLSLSRCLRQFVCPQQRGICRSSRSRMLQNFLFNF